MDARHPPGDGHRCLAGLATGVLGGLYPAWRAGRIQSAEALRR
ncbi:hypothetical protein [Streptomyces sp. NPDC007984]